MIYKCPECFRIIEREEGCIVFCPVCLKEMEVGE